MGGQLGHWGTAGQQLYWGGLGGLGGTHGPALCRQLQIILHHHSILTLVTWVPQNRLACGHHNNIGSATASLAASLSAPNKNLFLRKVNWQFT